MFPGMRSLDRALCGVQHSLSLSPQRKEVGGGMLTSSLFVTMLRISPAQNF